jgi:hypothetical protein
VDKSVDNQHTNFPIPRDMGAALKLALFSPTEKVLIFQTLNKDLCGNVICGCLS